jgi:hypothetical protein
MGEITMYYEINVSLNGKHFFATAERSIQDMAKLREVYRELAQRFLESEGYRLTVCKSQTTGHYMTEAEIYFQ